MKQQILDNAQQYLKTYPFEFQAKRALKNTMQETMRLYWEKTQRDGFATNFCGQNVKLDFASNKMPDIKFSASIDAYGEYSATTNTITIHPKLLNKPESLYTTLIHEVTHAIQHQLLESKNNYPIDSVEYNLLLVLEAEIKTAPEEASWEGINYGNRIYCTLGMECKGANEVSHTWVAPRVRAFYHMLEIERQARLMEIEWAKSSGICSPTFIQRQEEKNDTHLDALRDIFETDYLSKKAAVSAFQYAQINLAQQATPNKNKVIEIDMTYELAQMSSLFNGKITLAEYNNNVLIKSKEKFCKDKRLIANTRDVKIGTIPIMSLGRVNDEITKIPIQAPLSLAYKIIDNPKVVSQAREEQLNVLFAYVNELNNTMLMERLQEVLGEDYAPLEKKHLALYNKTFMTPAQAEKHYTSRFTFDLTGEKTTLSSQRDSTEEKTLQQDR